MEKIYDKHKLVGLQLFWSGTPTFSSETPYFLPDVSPESPVFKILVRALSVFRVTGLKI